MTVTDFSITFASLLFPPPLLFPTQASMPSPQPRHPRGSGSGRFGFQALWGKSGTAPWEGKGCCAAPPGWRGASPPRPHWVPRPLTAHSHLPPCPAHRVLSASSPLCAPSTCLKVPPLPPPFGAPSPSFLLAEPCLAGAPGRLRAEAEGTSAFVCGCPSACSWSRRKGSEEGPA